MPIESPTSVRKTTQMSHSAVKQPSMDAKLAFSLSIPVVPSSTTPLLSPAFSKSYPRLLRTRRTLVATLSLENPASSSETAPKPAAPFFASSTSFASLGLDTVFVEFLASQHITNPSGIQSRGIPPILGGADVVLGAATGSGKTLAYLLPVVQQLKNAEYLRNENDAPLRVARRPRAIILVPTRELADQVVSVARSLSHVAKFRVMGAVGGGSAAVPKKFREKLALPVDVLVSTTGRLLQLLKERSIDLRHAKHVIIDEVDTMFDAGFGPELRQIISASRGGGSRENRPQFISVGATHPRSAQAVYDEVFPSAKTIEVDLHRPPPGLEQRFIEVGRGNKLQELVALLGDAKKDGSLRGGRMMVFCNTMDSVRFVDHFLREAGYQTQCIHGDVPSGAREEAYEKFRSQECQILVCSDMAARGLDNLAVEHVVLFDFPTSAVDYLHRAGRTARAGAKGRVTSFVTKRDAALARAIEKAGSGRNDALEGARVAREAESIRRKREQDALRERREMMEEQALMMEDEGRSGGRGNRRFGNYGRGGGGGGGGGRGRGGRSGGRGGGRGGRGRRRSG